MRLTDYVLPGETYQQAATRAISEGYKLDKYADPMEIARDGLSAEEAGQVAAEDPGLVILRPSVRAER